MCVCRYENPTVLSLLAGPLSAHFAARLAAAAAEDQAAKAAPGETVGATAAGRLGSRCHVTTEVTLAHDVTLLALHHALEGSALRDSAFSRDSAICKNVTIGSDSAISGDSTIGSTSGNALSRDSSTSSSGDRARPPLWWPPFASAVVVQLTAGDSGSGSERDEGWGAGYSVQLWATPWALPGIQDSSEDPVNLQGPQLMLLQPSVPARAFEF